MRRNRELDNLKDNAIEAADFLSLVANDKRLLILCERLAIYEMSVGNLADAVDLSQSARSQHLSKLRTEGLVETRRASQTIFNKISADGGVIQTLSLLKKLFCR